MNILNPSTLQPRAGDWLQDGHPHPWGTQGPALHLHLQAEGGHGGQRATGEDEGADTLADQPAMLCPG